MSTENTGKQSGGLGARLYRGDISIDIVGRRKIWYLLAVVLTLGSIAVVGISGLNLGVEFKGGTVLTMPSATGTIDQAHRAVLRVPGAGEPIIQEVQSAVSGAQSGRKIRVQLGANEKANTISAQVKRELIKELGVKDEQINVQQIGPSWGEDISSKALLALVVFLIAVVIYMSVMFEWKMAAAAIVALVHDLIITFGIYALSGFVVTPATIIGVLTILGYSLYDTVVVFDKVKENTRGLTGGARTTYAEAANTALNQTLMRSLNTSVTALLPVGAILFVGVAILGPGVLTDISLAIFVGIAAGTYSSILIATPLLAHLKEREPAMIALAKRVASRRAQESARQRGQSSAAPAAEDGDAGGDEEPAGAGRAGATSRGQSRPGRPGGGQRRPGGKKRR